MRIGFVTQKIFGMRYLLIFLHFTMGLWAQVSVDYASIDKQSYEEYVRNDFKAIKNTVQLARKNSIAFYYLYMRAGIVAWNHSDYEYALPQFEKAYAMNPMDTVVQEYLYYAYLNTGKEEAADVLISKSISLQRKFDPSKSGIQSLTIGLSRMGAGKQSNLTLTNETSKSVYESSGMTIFHALMGIKVSNRLKLYSAIQYFGGKGNHTSVSALGSTSNNFTSKTYQLNLGTSYFRKKTFWYANAGYYSTHYSEYAPQQRGPFPPTALVDTSYKAASLTVGFNTSRRYVRYGIQTSWSTFDERNQYQVQANVTLFPFGNHTFFTKSGITRIETQQSGKWVWQQQLGVQLNRKLFLTASYTRGSMLYYQSENGYSNYFTTDPVRSEIGLALSVRLKRIEIIPSYYVQSRIKTISIENADGTISEQQSTYSPHLFNLSLKWKF